ncbi:hypothetical protein GMMP15_370033 [Candidatus Magnetomoraceae bacterium gMMP-15]
MAYGSDIELVQKTLLEIAEKNYRVYRKPSPDVVFNDFGDSALIFTLRVWVHVNFCISVPSEIRFEIDRLFREKNIVIAFPQSDVHLFIEKQVEPDFLKEKYEQ